MVHGTGKAVPDQLKQRLGTRVVVYGNSQAILDQ